MFIHKIHRVFGKNCVFPRIFIIIMGDILYRAYFFKKHRCIFPPRDIRREWFECGHLECCEGSATELSQHLKMSCLLQLLDAVSHSSSTKSVLHLIQIFFPYQENIDNILGKKDIFAQVELCSEFKQFLQCRPRNF